MTQTAARHLASLRKPLPGESAAYARCVQLLEEEIALQRQIDRVSEMRRSLPDGPLVAKDYRFEDMNGQEVGLVHLFGAHDTLITYFWMYGPERKRPCPMCTNLLGPLDANAKDLMERVSLAVLGRSTVERQLACAQERGWHALKFHQIIGDEYALDLGGLDPDSGSEWPVVSSLQKDQERQDSPVLERAK